MDKNASTGGFAYTLVTKWGTWILIFTNFVPISLQVTIEVVKFIQGIMISKDPLTFSPLYGGIAATVNSSNLNEELGQIEWIFSDKTGTLTSNIMKFRSVTVNGVGYGDERNMTDLEYEKLPFVTNVDFRD